MYTTSHVVFSYSSKTLIMFAIWKTRPRSMLRW